MIHSISLKEEPSSLTSQVKFIRRKDLTTELRLKIASIALFFTVKGGIRGMSKRHGVSHTFIYRLREQLAEQASVLFDKPDKGLPEKKTQRLQSLCLILLLRLVGRCSLGAISTLLTALGMPYDSTGYISQSLRQIGAALPFIIDWQGKVVYGSDELFYLGRHPILITVDVLSGAILHCEMLQALTKQAWVEHWQRLREKGIMPWKMVSDEGTVLRAARESFEPELPWQPDTFHALSLRLGVFQQRLDKKAEKAIGHEYQRQDKQESAKSPRMKQKQDEQWQQARQDSELALQSSEDFRFLYHCILEQNQVFMPNGQVRPRSFAEAETSTAIELMRTLAIPGLNKELDEIQNVLPNLYGFLDDAQQAITQLSEQMPADLLPFWTCAWQWEKKARKAKNNYPYQQRCLASSQLALELLQQHYQMNQADFRSLQHTIFSFLDAGTVQSSAMVECVNSFIRPYLNGCRDQFSPEFLNLLMFYYNHRPFERGKRKGKSPIEILSGNPPEKDWLDLLLQHVES